MAGAGPRKEIDGLVFYLDFANAKTFTGIGATASSLISSKSASLKYGVTYEGQYGGNINFDDDNDFIFIRNSTELQMSAGTVYCWVKTSITEPFFKSLITKNNAYGLYIRNGVPLCMDWSTQTEYSSGINIADGAWHYIALTFNSGVSNGSNLYIDGVLKVTFTVTVKNQLSDVYIGSNSFYPGVVKKGLVLHLDAQNARSYPGTGTTWFDLSGSDRHATLYNSPTFDSSSGGALSFNGTNQYAEVPNWGILTGTKNYTIITTLKHGNNSDQAFVSFGTGSSSTANQVGISASSIGALHSLNNLTFEVNNYIGSTWNTFAFAYTGSLIKFYFNGNIIKRKTATLNVGSTNLRIARSIINGDQYSNSNIANIQIYNRALTDAEVAQNYDVIKNIYVNVLPERTMGTISDPAPSGFALKSNYPDLSSGYYYIKNSSMPNALQMYVDMTNDGGGFDYYPIINGTSVSYITEVHSGTSLGLDLVYPRSQGHWKSMYEFVVNVLGSTTGTYLNTTGAIIRSEGFGNYSTYTMRDPNSYETGAPNWKVPDLGRWWLRDDRYGEPSGDYNLNGFMALYTILPNGYISAYNDGGTQPTGNYYLVSTNGKP